MVGSHDMHVVVVLFLAFCLIFSLFLLCTLGGSLAYTLVKMDENKKAAEAKSIEQEPMKEMEVASDTNKVGQQEGGK